MVRNAKRSVNPTDRSPTFRSEEDPREIVFTTVGNRKNISENRFSSREVFPTPTRKDDEMNHHQHHDHDALVQALWSAIFRGTRLRHVGAEEDSRVFVLRSILWGRQESKVVDVNTGEVFRFPWTALEFLDPVEGHLPGMPPAPSNL